MQEKPGNFVMERHGRLADMDRSFDIAYWQRLGPDAIFQAAWQLVVQAHPNDDLRIQRTVESLQRRRR